MIRQYKPGDQVTVNFKGSEFICKCPACQARGIVYLEDAFVQKLQSFRGSLGRAISLTPNGGNRCEARNKAVGGAASSRHLSPKHCDGADIYVTGIVPDDLAVLAERHGFSGVGVYSAGNHYIHVDTRPGTGARWWLTTSNSNTPGFGGTPCVFKAGHRSPAVTKIQAALGMKPDGKGTMDAATVKALKAFQAANKLDPDGAYGRATNAALGVFEW